MDVGGVRAADYAADCCAECAEDLDDRCPNCGGELMDRPSRAKALHAKYPPSTERKYKG